MFLIFIAMPLMAFSQEAPAEVEEFCEVLIEATQENDLEKFKSVCDEQIKETMTSTTLSSISSQVSGLFKNGYERTYLGVLDKVTFKTYLWKLDFSIEGVPDTIASMSVSNGKVSGFYLR